MATPEFPRRDPADPGFWDLRYEARFVPWDAGKVPARLREFVEAAPSPLRTLVPGCGSAWDVRYFAESGWNVTGLDFSAQAVAAAREVLGPHGDCVRQGDVFAPIAGEPFDLVYERAFLCALPRRLWTGWSLRMASLLAPGAILAGFFFFDEGERGPPFPLHSIAELEGLLAGDFVRIEDFDVRDSIPVFAGKERWQRWQRR